MMTTQQQHRLTDLEISLEAHGKLIEKQKQTLDQREDELFAARATAAVAWAALAAVLYQWLVATPVLWCPL